MLLAAPEADELQQLPLRDGINKKPGGRPTAHFSTVFPLEKTRMVIDGEPICVVSLPLGLGFGLVKAKDALLLNIASIISCHKLAGVALARCSWRSVKNDPPTA